MTNTNDKQHRALLQRIARRAMVERGLLPDFSPQALAELDGLRGPAAQTDTTTRDLRHLLWCSIDNDDSRDLDQLTVAEAMPDKSVKVLVAVADVDTLVKKGSAIDEHARKQYHVGIYCCQDLSHAAGKAFDGPYVPQLRVGPACDDRRTGCGRGGSAAPFRCVWSACPEPAQSWPTTALPPGWRAPARSRRRYRAVPGLEENLRIQDRVAQQLKTLRHEHGALTLETVEARLVFDADELKDLQAERKNRAKDIIEDLMIAANGVTARFLSAKGLPSFRRVVRTPEAVGPDQGTRLGPWPDASREA